MRVRALKSFSGPSISMYPGQEIELVDKGVLNDLLSAKYIEEVKEEKPSKRGVKKNESK